MEYRQLKYILKTAEEKSFSLAAKKLYISQPSLSQLIAKTEEKIGAPLFDRSATPIQLTYIGEMYVEMARQILDTYGEDRGEGRRLYRFPVVFPSDQWQTVMPHELAAWGTHEKHYWSEYAADGRQENIHIADLLDGFVGEHMPKIAQMQHV